MGFQQDTSNAERAIKFKISEDTEPKVHVFSNTIARRMMPLVCKKLFVS
jgi:hypothetical protein